MQSFLILVAAPFAFVATVSAQTQSVTKRIIEETYWTGHAIGIRADFTNWDGASDGCYIRGTASIGIDLGIGIASSFFDATYSNRAAKNCALSNPNELVEKFAQLQPEWAQTSTSFNLVAMSPELDSIFGKVVYEGPAISKYVSAAGRSKVEYPFTARLTQCQNASGKMIEARGLKQGISVGADLRQTLAQLRDLSLDRLVRCDFQVTVGTILGDLEKKDAIRHFTFRVSTIERDERIFFQTTPVSAYTRLNGKRDLQAETKAMAAAGDLMRFITDNYGDVLYRINDLKKSEAEKSEIIRAYFEKNESLVRDWLSIIDQNYAEVSLMNKISMLTSFDQMYASIREIESRVSKSNVTLDRIIRHPVR